MNVVKVEPAVKTWELQDADGNVQGTLKIEDAGGSERVTLTKGTSVMGNIVFGDEHEIAGVFEKVAQDLRAEGK